MKRISLTLAMTVTLILASLGFGQCANATGAVPSAPLNLTVAGIQAHGITVTWNTPADIGSSDLTNYVVAVSRDAGATWHNAINLNFDDLTTQSQSQTVTALDDDFYWLRANTSFKIKVAAVNDSGRSDFSSTLTAMTKKGVPRGDYGVGVANKFGPHGGLLLTWQAPDDDGGSKILGYKIYYRAAGTKPGVAGTSKWLLMKNLGPKVFAFETLKFTKGKNWEIDVRALNSLGLSGGWPTVVDIAKSGKMQFFH